MDIVKPTTGDVSEKESGRAVIETSVERVTGLDSHEMDELLAVEEPLEIQLGYGPAEAPALKSISVTMRTPGYDFELAAGFLMTEGVVRDVNDINGIVYAAESAASIRDDTEDRSSVLGYQPRKNIVRVERAPDVKISIANLERNFYTTSSCGICGKASLLALQTVCPARVRNAFSIDAQLLYMLPARLREAQRVFDRTGGLHGAGLFDAAGKLLGLRED
jgi:FdhD protein